MVSAFEESRSLRAEGSPPGGNYFYCEIPSKNTFLVDVKTLSKGIQNDDHHALCISRCFLIAYPTSERTIFQILSGNFNWCLPIRQYNASQLSVYNKILTFFLCVTRYSLDDKTWEVVQPAADSEVTTKHKLASCILSPKSA